MVGILLDTHALYWLVSGENDLSEAALVAIGESQQAGTLFVSPITAWELSVATGKARAVERPNLGDQPAGPWFRHAVRAIRARVIPIHQRIACEAADVVLATGHKDPGDCFLIATARVRKAALVTRDRAIRSIANGDAGYLDVIIC